MKLSLAHTFYKLLFLSLWLLPASHQLLAQTELMSPIPPPPEAASLGKFVDVPVSLYTGTPSIDVPIYTIQGKELSLPISISYHASGLKVEEISSWVGAGWTLNAGGVVSRTVRGLVDEHSSMGWFSESSKGFFNANGTVNFNALMCNDENLEELNWLTTGQMDSEPDLYFFSIPGKSGKFVFPQSVNGADPILIPQQPIRIQHPFLNYTTTMPLNGYEWEITTEDGTRYIFGQGDQTLANTNCGSLTPISNEENTWHLLEIISATGKEKITFEYEPETIFYTQLASVTESRKLRGSSFGPNRIYLKCTYNITVSGSRLKRITSSTGYEVIFNASETDRLDLRGSKSLDNIVVKYKQEVLQIHRLYQSYFKATPTETDPDDICKNHYLKLDSINQFNSAGASLPSYVFEYSIPHKFPGRGTYNQDHWGYFNGAGNNGSSIINLVPRLVNDIYDLEGADREPDLIYAKAGILEKIIYPTGGYTTFDYQLHDYGNLQSDDLYEMIPRTYSASVVGNDNNLAVTDTESFTIEKEVSATFSVNRPCTNAEFGCYTKIEKDGQVINLSPTTGNRVLLQSGNYVLTAHLGSGMGEENYGGQQASITIKFEEIDISRPVTKKVAGGLRVAEVVMYDGVTGSTIVKNYEYKVGDTDVSSGKIMAHPKYDYVSHKNDGKLSSDGMLCVESEIKASYLVRTSKSNIPLGNTQGSHIGYDEVAVIYGDTKGKTNGKTIYKYSNDVDFANHKFPFVPNISTSYRNGLLKEQIDYQYTTAAFIKVREKINKYGILNTLKVFGFKTAYTETSGCITCGHVAFGTTDYWETSEKIQLNSTIERVYDNSESTFKENYFFYKYEPSNHLANSILSVDSKGNVLWTRLKYPANFTGATTTALWKLNEDHIFTPVIEKQLWKSSSVLLDETKAPSYQPDKKDFALTAATFTSYALFNETALPNTIYSLDIPRPITSSSFRDATHLNSDTPTDPKYTARGSYIRYDELNNILSVAKTGGDTVSYIWGYDKRYPIAEVQNAPETQLAYTSFESNDKGNWTFDLPSSYSSDAVTGKRSATVNLQKKALKKGDYVVSLWAKGSGTVTVNGEAKAVGEGWAYLEWRLSSVSSVSIQAKQNLIDEVRLYPQGAFMTTYTYEPGVGISAETDPNNMTTYFEYDQFNRPVIIKDHNKNIVRENEYHYAREN